MTTGGVLAGCAAGGVVAGPLLDRVAVRLVGRARAASATAAASAPPGTASPPLPAGVTRAGPAPLAPTAGAPDTAGAPVPIPTSAVPAALVTGGLLVLLAARLGAVPELAAYCVLVAGMVALSIVDLRFGLVPRKLLYPTAAVTAAGLVAASAAGGHWGALGGAAIGGAGAFLVFTAVWWVYPKGMGFGDVRLAGACGMALGWLGLRQLYVGFLAAFALGLVFGLANMAVRRTSRFPFAPALAAGTVVGLLWGGYLGNLWLHAG